MTTNLEKFKDTILDILTEHGTTFALYKETGLPVPCCPNGIPCSECAFNDPNIECPELRRKWISEKVYDGEINVAYITDTIPDDLDDAVRALYYARRLACSSADCGDCKIKESSYCFQIAEMNTLFYIIGPELSEEVKKALLKWGETAKACHPEYFETIDVVRLRK